MKQTVTGNIKCCDISCTDEDIEKSMNKPIVIRCADIYLRFPEIMEEEANDLADFLEEEHIVYEGATDVFIEKDKEIERLNNILDEIHDLFCLLDTEIMKQRYDRANRVNSIIREKLRKLEESSNNES